MSCLIYDCILEPEKGERACLLLHMEKLQSGNVLVLDRGYFSYLILIKAIEKGIHLICRMQSGSVNKEVQAFWDSDKIDEVITYTPSTSVKYESKKQGYDIDLKPVKLRLIKYIIGDETYVCCTTLFGENYPLNEFAAVYHGRWGDLRNVTRFQKNLLMLKTFIASLSAG